MGLRFLPVISFLFISAVGLAPSYAQDPNQIIEELATAKAELAIAEAQLAEAEERDVGDDELEILKRNQAIATAQAAILDAKLKTYIAQQKYDEATKEKAAVSEEEKARQADIATAEAAQKVAEANKAASDAQKAAAEAKVADIKAQSSAIFGDVPKSGIAGDVTVGDGAGDAEATLLAAKAMNDLASEIAGELESKVRGKNVWIVANDTVPDMYHKLTFQQQSGHIIGALEAAITASDQTETDLGYQKDFLEAVPVAAIAAGVEAFANLGSFFKTDYTVAGATIPDFGDQPLIDSIAGALNTRGATVFAPNTYHPALPMFDPANNEVLKTLLDITTKKLDLEGKKAKWEDRQNGTDAELTTKLSDLKKQEASGAAANVVSQTRQAIENLKLKKSKIIDIVTKIGSAITASEGFITGWTTVGENGTNLVKDLILADYMAGQLKNGDLMLVMNLTAVKGSHYTKKNLWTFFGKMPFYNMGGAVVNYRLINGSTGAVVAAATKTKHGGFHKSSKVKAFLEGR